MRTMVDLSMQFAEPAAAENWIQIMKTGSFQHPKHGELQITDADLHLFKENFDKKVRGVDLAVDVSHDPDKGAVGWFKELRVEPGKLMARVAWTEEGKEMVAGGKFRYFSPEFAFQYQDAETGKQFKDVLLGGAITNRPFLKNMAPIELSEDGGYVVFADFDPDNDGDNDKTTDPNQNPDWIDDVKHGWTPWPTDPKQVEQLKEAGVTKDMHDKAKAAFDRNNKGKPPKKQEEPKPAPKKPEENTTGVKKMTEETVTLAELEAERNARIQLQEKVRRMELSETVKGFLFNESTKKGKLMPAQHDSVLDFMMTLNDEQTKKFTEVINALPDAISFNDERGHGGKGKGEHPTKSREDLVEDRAVVLMTEKSLTYKEALALADTEVPKD